VHSLAMSSLSLGGSLAVSPLHAAPVLYSPIFLLHAERRSIAGACIAACWGPPRDRALRSPASCARARGARAPAAGCSTRHRWRSMQEGARGVLLLLCLAACSSSGSAEAAAAAAAATDAAAPSVCALELPPGCVCEGTTLTSCEGYTGGGTLCVRARARRAAEW
jgi:hypothetical protein